MTTTAVTTQRAIRQNLSLIHHRAPPLSWIPACACLRQADRNDDGAGMERLPSRARPHVRKQDHVAYRC